jgi:ParB/RepB/Spo0J family partition protein
MIANLEKTAGFTGKVEKISLTSIRPSERNPRGIIEKNENYFRLVASINKLHVLVPIVVRELPHPKGEIKYELMDGERRYWAAKECGKDEVPAHILSSSNSLGNLRKLMFHLHMTREDWSALAQCRALSEAYPKLDEGLKFSEKAEWIKTLTKEIAMGTATARDRINVLAWPKVLKERFYEFDEKENSKDIYSYVLAIEVSIVVPSRDIFHDYYNHDHPPEHSANKVRASLLEKTMSGLEKGIVTSREQIRGISPLFCSDLDAVKKKIALSLFKDFIDRKEIQFDDLRAEISAKLPEALKEKPPKPQRVIATIRALDRTLRDYDPSYVDDSVSRSGTREKLRREFIESLDGLAAAIKTIKGKFQ